MASRPKENAGKGVLTLVVGNWVDDKDGSRYQVTLDDRGDACSVKTIRPSGEIIGPRKALIRLDKQGERHNCIRWGANFSLDVAHATTSQITWLRVGTGSRNYIWRRSGTRVGSLASIGVMSRGGGDQHRDHRCTEKEMTSTSSEKMMPVDSSADHADDGSTSSGGVVMWLPMLQSCGQSWVMPSQEMGYTPVMWPDMSRSHGFYPHCTSAFLPPESVIGIADSTWTPNANAQEFIPGAVTEIGVQQTQMIDHGSDAGATTSNTIVHQAVVDTGPSFAAAARESEAPDVFGLAKTEAELSEAHTMWADWDDEGETLNARDDDYEDDYGNSENIKVEAVGSTDGQPRVLLRGLPFQASVNDIKQFLGLYVQHLKGDGAIQILRSRGGRASGYCEVYFKSSDIVEKATCELHNRVMRITGEIDSVGRGARERYIEVFSNADCPLKAKKPNRSSERAVRCDAAPADECNNRASPKRQPPDAQSVTCDTHEAHTIWADPDNEGERLNARDDENEFGHGDNENSVVEAEGFDDFENQVEVYPLQDVTKEAPPMVAPLTSAVGENGGANIQRGSRVEAQWGSEWHPGVVRQILPNGDVDVLWDSEPSISHVPRALVRQAFQVGDQVEAYWGSELYLAEVRMPLPNNNVQLLWKEEHSISIMPVEQVWLRFEALPEGHRKIIGLAVEPSAEVLESPCASFPAPSYPPPPPPRPQPSSFASVVAASHGKR